MRTIIYIYIYAYIGGIIDVSILFGGCSAWLRCVVSGSSPLARCLKDYPLENIQKTIEMAHL